MTYLKYIAFICFNTISFFAPAQFYQLDLPITAPTLSNPAFTGTFSYGSLNFNRYSQSAHINATDFSYQTHVSPLKGGVGLSYQYLKIGFEEMQQTSLSYGTKFHLNKALTLSMGASAIYKNTSNSWSPQPNPNYLPQIPNKINFSTGLLLYSKQFFVGLSAHQLNDNIYKNTIKGLVGYEFRLKNDLLITPNITFVQQHYYQSIKAKINLKFKDYKALIGYDFSKEMLAGIGWERNRFSLYYMFAYYNSTLTSDFHQATSHRFSVLIKLPKSIQADKNTFDFNLF